MRFAKLAMPPPPIPCTAVGIFELISRIRVSKDVLLPSKNTEREEAAPHSALPTEKMARIDIMTCLRPKI